MKSYRKVIDFTTAPSASSLAHPKQPALFFHRLLACYWILLLLMLNYGALLLSPRSLTNSG